MLKAFGNALDFTVALKDPGDLRDLKTSLLRTTSADAAFGNMKKKPQHHIRITP